METGPQMKLNIQEVLGDVNPLFKKFVQEGSNPATYITKNKRRQIYEYMTRDTIAKRKCLPTPPLNRPRHTKVHPYDRSARGH